MPNEAAMPGDTGWSPKANGTVELVLDDGPGAFWAPRTLVVEPRGAVHRAAVLALGLLSSLVVRVGSERVGVRLAFVCFHRPPGVGGDGAH